MPNLPQRFQIIDARLARMDRQMGVLVARLYWKTGTEDWGEVEIFSHNGYGLTPKNWKTGVEIEGYRFRVTVSKGWYESQQRSTATGTYGIQQTEGAPILPCELEDQTVRDGDPYASLSFRIIATVPTFF
jgi:hypothetical protein